MTGNCPGLMVIYYELRALACNSEQVGRLPTMRVHITLECTECHERNYLSSKNRRNNPDRVEFKKYCPRDRKVTLHRETK